MIPVVISVLGTVRNELEGELDELEIRRQIETIQTSEMLR